MILKLPLTIAVNNVIYTNLKYVIVFQKRQTEEEEEEEKL